MSSIRRLLVSAALAIPLVVPLVLGPIAHADDGPAAPKDEEPRPLRPVTELRRVRMPFTLAEILPAPDDLPDGWSEASIAQVLAEPEGAPNADVLARLARAAGVPGDAAQIRSLGIVREDEQGIVHGVLAYVVLGVEGRTLAPRIAKAAEAHGWQVRNVGVPSAVLVAWSGDRAATPALLDWQTARTVRALCDRGWRAMSTARQGGDPIRARTRFARGQAMIAAARDTLPDAGHVQAILARIFVQDTARASEHARKAIAPRAPVPAPPAILVGMAFSIGAQLLTRGGPEDLPTAAAVLEAGVAVEDAAEHPNQRFGNRYNLACTYARQGRIDAAFVQLEESLRYIKSAWEAEKRASPDGRSALDYPGHHAHAKVRDPDLASLRSDPRFARLMAAYDPARGAAGKPAGAGN